jgi:apolipoprotein N-acyltransferase
MKKLPHPWLLLVSGLLLILSFPPFDLVIPPFFALLPLFFFVEYAVCTRQLVLGGLLVGAFFWIALLYWVSIFSVAGFVALIIYLTAYPVLFLIGLDILWKRARLPLWLVGPFLWVALEHFRAVGELAFTWGQLCYSISYHPLLLQMADLVGPYGVSLWIVLINTLIYTIIVNSGRVKSSAVCALLLVVIIPVAYGISCIGRVDLIEGDEIDISLIQPNIDQDRKWSRSYRDTSFTILEDLSLEALDAAPDLVVWPETAVPAFVRHNSFYRRRVSRLVEASGIPYLVGAQDYEVIDKDEYMSFNSAFLFREDGKMEEEWYSKIRLVPFGEKVPYEDWFPILRKADLGGGHFTSGGEFTLFDVGEHRFGVLICFESIFPELSREFCRSGANFLLNITNDAWFLRTSAPYQHASVLPLRAIENRIYIGRSANTGITMIVDPLGRVVDDTLIFTKAVISGKIYARSTDTFYRRHGDLVVYLSWIVLFLAAIRFLHCRMLNQSD